MSADRSAAGSASAIRAFVALDLDDASVRRIADVSERLQAASGAPAATWTGPAKMHVTLKFIGQLPTNAIAPLGTSLGELVEGKPPPRPGSFRLDAFPSPVRARIVVAELLDPDDAIGKLAGRVEALTAPYGIEHESRAFRAHVTLARLKAPYDARRWLNPELVVGAPECKAAALVLYRSQLGRDGATYTPLARYAWKQP